MKIAVAHWWFKSSSGNGVYETTLWRDKDSGAGPTLFTYSCNCPGWCRKVTNLGRTCKHVRECEQFGQTAPNAIKYSYVYKPGQTVAQAKPHLLLGKPTVVNLKQEAKKKAMIDMLQNMPPLTSLIEPEPEPPPPEEPYSRKFNI